MTVHHAGPVRDPALEARLAQEPGLAGRAIFAYREVPSTMDVAHELAAAGEPDGALIWAERQTQGRGRMSRKWESPAGGVYCSVVLRPSRPQAEHPQLSLVAGLAAAEAVERLSGLHPSIRWPNDLLLDGRKLAGILLEARQDWVVLGFGINVTTPLAQLPEGATSLAAHDACGAEPYRVTAAWYEVLQTWYQRWSRDGFAPIREALRPRLALLGQIVRIAVDGRGEMEGQALNVDEAGRLLVRLDSGLARAFDVGEVALLR